MSVELLYTSAAQGLKQGSRGFCTVLSTIGMPVNLANRLESLSAYRHVFPPNSPDAAQNPVSYSHLRITVGGRPLSILARISDYGVDYSQRTNKLAHHVVVEGPDLVAAGPAWVMSQPSIMRSQWDGQCATPATGPTVPPSNQSARVCLRWGGLCNDAGWGGVVAEAFAQPPGKPLWIIFTLAQSAELLGLINESIALLPVEQRWQATFSTYATNLPPDAECKVRCVLAGTDDARLAPARGKVIDLSKPVPPIAAAGTTAYVLAARNGTIPLTPQALRPIGHATTPITTHGVPSDSAPAHELTPQLEFKLQPSSSKPSRLPAVPPAKKKTTFPTGTATNQPPYSAAKRRLNLVIIGLSIAASLLLTTTVVLLVQRNKTTEIATANKESISEKGGEQPNAADADEANSKKKDANTTGDGKAEELSNDGQTQSGAASDTNSTPKPPAAKATPDAPSETPPSTPTVQLDTPQAPSIEQSTTVESNELTTTDSVVNATAKTETLLDRQAGSKPSALPGKLQILKLFKGEVCVQIEIEQPADAVPKETKYVYKKEKQSVKPLDSLAGGAPTEDRPHNIKNIICKQAPFVIVVEVDPRDRELRGHANTINASWKALLKDIGDWRTFVSKDMKIQPKQKQELEFETLDEPSDVQTIQDLNEKMKEYAESIVRLKETVTDAPANKEDKEQAKIVFAPYEVQIKKIDENMTKILDALDAITKIKRDFQTGAIMYIGEKVERGRLVDPTEISATFNIDPTR